MYFRARGGGELKSGAVSLASGEIEVASGRPGAPAAPADQPGRTARSAAPGRNVGQTCAKGRQMTAMAR
jgi:hypothetical protein